MRQIGAFGLGDGSQNWPSPNESPRIAVFPKGPTPWRLDWFGDIAFPDRSIRRKQPSVFVHLSRVTDSRFREDPTVLLSAHSTTPPSFQRRVWVSVGTLPLLRVGDVWRDGQLDIRPDYELEEFTDIQIDQDTTKLIKAGLNLDEDGFLLPLSEHPWHMQCTQSYCLLVDLPDSRRMIIPCMELVRFYFGSSSSLLTRLFLPPLARDSLYEKASMNTRTGQLMLALADKMSGASAADIGRLHLEPAAWRAAAHVGTSILKASVANQAIYPQAIFPFEGKTTLVASGRWLSFADQPRATFLVYNLRSCAHPFPFRSLRYEAKGSHSKPQPSRKRAPDANVSHTWVSARDANDQAIVEHDPSTDLAPHLRSFHVEPRFPDLIPKHVWRIEIASSENIFPGKQYTTKSVENAALGEPGSRQRTRPLDVELLANTEHLNFESIPEFLRETIFQLHALKSIKYKLLTESDSDGWTVPISILPNEDGEIDSQLFISQTDGSWRLRRASLLEIGCGPQCVCAVVIESEPVFRKIYPATGLAPNEISRTLQCSAVDFVNRQDLPQSIHSLVNSFSWFLSTYSP